jgi:hypothetical protein
VHGRDSLARRRTRYGPRVGYDYVHAAIDDHIRLAYAEIHPDERAATCAGSCAAPRPRSPSWDRPHRVGDDRQRHGLPPLGGLAGGPRRTRAGAGLLARSGVAGKGALAAAGEDGQPPITRVNNPGPGWPARGRSTGTVERSEQGLADSAHFFGHEILGAVRRAPCAACRTSPR